MSKLRDELNVRLRERLSALASYLYPNGKKLGASWRVGSLDINLRTGWWGDWDGSTQHMSRNLLDLWIYATGTPYKTATREITNWLGLPDNELPTNVSVGFTTPQPERKLLFPLLERPTRNELNALSLSRSISVEALLVAVERGFLWTYTDPAEKVRAWLINRPRTQKRCRPTP
jgi:twinkle protein